nr:immunoglobulin heavy chain junction region [Macaca mulatta]MOY20677.1 immunoglobulin heavy chain junction region [Macaca mulatta]
CVKDAYGTGLDVW